MSSTFTYSCDLEIDWGDGSEIEHIVKTDAVPYTNPIIHNYPDPDSLDTRWNIKISGWTTKFGSSYESPVRLRQINKLDLESLRSTNVSALTSNFDDGITSVEKIHLHPQTLYMNNAFYGYKYDVLPDNIYIPDSVQYIQGIFKFSENLVDLGNVKIPKSVTNAYQAFQQCYKITNDVSTLFPESFISSSIDLSLAFQYCYELTGSVPADKLWNNTNITWTSGNCFDYCNNLTNYSEIPDSWK